MAAQSGEQLEFLDGVELLEEFLAVGRHRRQTVCERRS